MRDLAECDLTIIIVSWNTRELLAHCLGAVYATVRGCTFRVVVVDNGSADGSAQMVCQCFPQAHLVENRENAGFARANNQAIELSQGRFVLLLNSDTIPQPGALDRMVKFMEDQPGAGIVGANILNPDNTPQLCFGKFPSVLSESMTAWGFNSRWPLSRWQSPPLGFSGEHIETDWVLGAALLIRHEVLIQAGGLDEDYFMYSEEVDLAYRVKKVGWHVFVLGTAPVVHLGGQSSQQIPAPMKAELFRSKVRYFLKHHGQTSAGVVNAMFGASILGKRWVYRLLGKMHLSNMWSETWAYYSGAKQLAKSGSNSQ
jgi:N-acetylglucosaminyl-diphospho-decaprenol L-rhamnosyltransferase